MESLSPEQIEEREANKRKYSSAGEAEVVFVAQLIPILKQWRDNWNAERSQSDETKFGEGSLVMGSIDWLAMETGIHYRRLWGIMKGEFKYLSVWDADKILTAIGKQDYLANHIHVIPNPNWNLERWQKYMEERGCF